VWSGGAETGAAGGAHPPLVGDAGGGRLASAGAA